jgi:hypothetical protein
MAGYAVAGAAAGAAVVFTLLIAGPTQDDPAQELVPTTATVVPTTVLSEVVTPTSQPKNPVEEPQAVAPIPSKADDEPAIDPVDLEPPLLKLLSPSDGEHFEKSIVTFSGITEPGAVVLASGKYPAHVDAEGQWNVDLVLAPGANGVLLTATDEVGNVSEIRATVHLDVEDPDVEEPKETTTTTVAEWMFTANQKYGTCTEPVPYDLFSGNAKPGTVVSITSPYGNGTAEVNVDGVWSIQVNFPTAPFNEQFAVKVKDYTGAKKTFQFVSLFEG